MFAGSLTGGYTLYEIQLREPNIEKVMAFSGIDLQPESVGWVLSEILVGVR